MHHDRTQLRPSRARPRSILQLEPLREIEIALDGGALPAAADRILDLDVDLRPVEGSSALVHRILPLLSLERSDQSLGGLLPYVIAAHALGGSRAQHDFKLREAELAQHLLDQSQHANDLIFKLRGQTENVRIVLRKPAHSKQPMERARPLVAVHGAQLCPAQRQVAVGLGRVLKEQAVEGTVHRLQLVLLLLHLHRLEHIVPVKIKVAGGFPQIQIGDVWRVQNVVPVLDMLFFPIGFDQVAHDRPLGVPKDQPAAGILLDGKQFEGLAQRAVVTAFRLLQLQRVRL
mmetsp:Transcript_30352/g.51992  ORF Transcript_30352/g.51992 Transcript_30352/m.51992 type:complete len:288 (-) Transcript_30352:750-1613(-)